jgi:hypothetical protein
MARKEKEGQLVILGFSILPCHFWFFQNGIKCSEEKSRVRGENL